MSEKETIIAFNLFIEKWCGTYSAHLLDSDENDGEYFRELLKANEMRYTTLMGCFLSADERLAKLKKQYQELDEARAIRDRIIHLLYKEKGRRIAHIPLKELLSELQEKELIDDETI